MLLAFIFTSIKYPMSYVSAVAVVSVCVRVCVRVSVWHISVPQYLLQHSDGLCASFAIDTYLYDMHIHIYRFHILLSDISFVF